MTLPTREELDEMEFPLRAAMASGFRSVQVDSGHALALIQAARELLTLREALAHTRASGGLPLTEEMILKWAKELGWKGSDGKR